MGIWVGKINLLPGEVLKWRTACNWKQGGQARGGHLGLTSIAVVFEPNRVDALTGGRSQRVPLGEIPSVSVEAGGSPSFAGGLRPRMRIQRRNGDFDLILVNRLEERLRQVEQAVAEFRARE